MKSPFIYIRGLRHVDHTVFAVDEGQKYYYDQQFKRDIAYSSGQQVKRSIISELNLPFAAITFNWVIDKKGKAEMKEPHSPCDPTYTDQLLGGYMKAERGKLTVKRRSPLSISAMRPLHPLLGGLERQKENVVFDRSEKPAQHKVLVSTVNEKGDRVELSDDELEEWLVSNERSLGPKYFNKNGMTRTSGLFVYDIAIDLRTLFCVSANKLEPELFPEIEKKLKDENWIETENIFGKCYLCPKEKREEIIENLASALVNWRITSNQSRTFSPMETLALAISDNANQITYAIRAELQDTERPSASPVIDETARANMFVTPVANSYIKNAVGSANALEEAEKYLIEKISEFDFENQL